MNAVAMTDVTLFHAERDQERDRVTTVITLPTFRRPAHLKRTLESLAALETDERIAVIVIENDADGREGAKMARECLASMTCPATVLIAHNRGNCHAYNAGWSRALALYPRFTHLAVIDDDELALPEWLAALHAVAKRTGADIVGGPQIPIFEASDSDRWKAHPVFTPHYAESGSVPILYSSGNVLIARKVLDAMPQPFLDPVFNFIGGGDSDFYRRARNAGFRFAWSAEAAVLETTPARRTEHAWVTARSLRNGAISTLLDHRQRPGAAGRIRTFAKSLALLAMSPARAIPLAVKSGSLYTGLYHIQVALGRLQAEFGMVGEQYREPEKN